MLEKLDLRKLETDIHPTAVVHPWAKIGEGVKIGPYAVIGETVQVGDGCVIGPHVQLQGHTTIGHNNSFFHGASIGGIPQDLKYNGEPVCIEIGDNNIFREFVTVNGTVGPGDSTKIGSECFLMAYAHVAHNCVIGDNVILANSVNLGGHVEIHDFAIIGGVTPVHQFVRVGQHAFIGGGSRVERDIPPFVKAAGSPPRVYGINTIGLERRGFSEETRGMIKKMFNVLYRSDLNVSQVLERLKNGDFQDPERRIFVDFLESSERGINK